MKKDKATKNTEEGEAAGLEDLMVEEKIEISITRQTFFIDDEEEEGWFDKEKEGEEDEDELEIYFMDDDKSW